jgi:hypothetical protein
LRNLNVKTIVINVRKEIVMANSITSMNLMPRLIRPAPDPLGLYFRVGRGDHRALLDLLAGGETRFFGLVCDPTHAKFQRELVERAVERRLDVILDPRTQASATIGGFTESLGDLPWGRGRIHTEDDFRGAAGRRAIANLARFVAEHGYTQVLTPSHLIRSTSDDWWEIDLRCARDLREELDRVGCSSVSVLCSLPITYAMLRNPAERRALIQGLKGCPTDGLWLAIDGVGSSSTPTAVRTYLEAVAEFHTLGIPLIADHAGGLVGLSFVAFGGVGALAHGITHGERFDTAHWRRPRGEESFGMQRRVYVPSLDMLLKPAEAQMLFDFGRRAIAQFGCSDTKCCPRGVTDMLQNPAHHFLRQRIDEISKLSSIPESLRANRFVEHRLRPITDTALAAAGLDWKEPEMAKRMQGQRLRLDRMRVALGNLAEEARSHAARTMSVPPRRRIVRVNSGRPSASP